MLRGRPTGDHPTGRRRTNDHRKVHAPLSTRRKRTSRKTNTNLHKAKMDPLQALLRESLHHLHEFFHNHKKKKFTHLFQDPLRKAFLRNHSANKYDLLQDLEYGHIHNLFDGASDALLGFDRTTSMIFSVLHSTTCGKRKSSTIRSGRRSGSNTLTTWTVCSWNCATGTTISSSVRRWMPSCRNKRTTSTIGKQLSCAFETASLGKSMAPSRIFFAICTGMSTLFFPSRSEMRSC